MMRALVVETRTGDYVGEVQMSSWSYDTGILAQDKVTLEIPAYTRRARTTDMRDLLTPRKHSIALVDDSVAGQRRVPAAGSIEELQAGQDDDGKDRWSLTCYGPERAVQMGAKVRLFPGWPLVHPTTGLPTTEFDVSFSGIEYGTMMKRLLVEAMKFPGGQLPIEFEPDRAGTRVKNYAAIDGKNVLEAIDDLADLIGGVEYDFQPSILDDDTLRYRMVTGTDAVGMVVGPASGHLWNLGGEQQDVRGWERRVNPGSVVTDAMFTGGKEDDRVMIARASSSELIDQGWPRAELWDSSHSSVSEQDALQGWADAALGGVTETAKLEVRNSVARLLRHGDVVALDAQGHWDMPDGETWWRVLSVGRKSDSADWLQVSLVR